ncbi:hypothetical protein MU852_04190 [Brevundimonas albigilva]|uniref:thermonuclease family protein n=1 Tax=Brevundimonas albigilva TaxID=1312364 RepID=UPI00201B55BD|nr:hypothetical protein [Brevundimonas albigilva]UQV19071.1 hypothetical protein MU852_04190 [Brevundimonas albigilva]
MTRAAFGCAILLVAGCTAPALTDAAPVVAQIRIIDGDTFEIDGEVVRIANIDTPEKGRRAKCFAEARLADAATEALEAHAADWRTSPPIWSAKDGTATAGRSPL